MGNIFSRTRYHPKLSVNIVEVYVIQSHEVKEGSKENFMFGPRGYIRFGRRYTCFLGYFFVKNAKVALEHFLNDPNRTKFENRENIENREIPVKSVKLPFSIFKMPKHCHFLRYLIEILYT